MIGAAERIHELVSGLTVEELALDRQRHEALLWNFTVLGEAAAQISDELEQRFPAVPWQRPVRFRNRIVHGYWSVDLELVHTTALDHLPGLVLELQAVASALADDDAPGTRDV